MRFVYNVYDFMVATEQMTPLANKDEKLADLYHRLMEEEFKEFMEATTPVKKLDACMDLIWVTIGYCIANAWDIRGAWDEVSRTNMTKVQTDPDTGKVKRREDGKILKPADWQEPNFTPYLNEEERG